VSIVTEYRLGEAQIHDILSNERRRRTLDYLKREQATVELRTLAESIAEAESGESPPPTELRQSVYNSLHQTHLPTLDDFDIIEYDTNRKTISLRPEVRTIDIYMDVLTPYGITWSTYYRTLGVLALLTIVADQLDVLLLSGDYSLVIAVVFLFVIAISTGYQLWSNQWLHLRGLLQ
jgi:curved DNA-binding protein CbpA